MPVSSHLPLPEGPDMKPVLGVGLEGLETEGAPPKLLGGVPDALIKGRF